MISAAAMCLAMNIYHEARDQGLVGQMAVAEVTMNRVEDKRWPNTVCKVVWQKNQFSWTHDGKTDRMYERIQRENAIIIANAYVRGKMKSNFTNGSTFYHGYYVNPGWSKKYKKTITIGSHIFYK